MPSPKFIDIDGKRFVWRELLQRRREQVAAAARVEQPVLFEMKEDTRPDSERTAAGRYREPSLFAFMEREGLRVIRLRATVGLRLSVTPRECSLPALRVEYVTKSRSSPATISVVLSRKFN
jgi:hypothetical protein